MRSLRKREAPGKRGCREPPRKKFAKWLAAPVLAVGMLFSGCMSGQTPGQNRPDATISVPDASQCETSTYQKQVNDSTTQNVEQTWCNGVLEMEVSTFTPPLENDTQRKALDLVDAEYVLLNSEPTTVLLGSEAIRTTLSTGESVEHEGYTITLDSITDGKALITIKDADENIIEEKELEMNRLWYTFYVSSEDVILLDLYGISDVAEISLFYGRLDDGLLVASDHLNDGTIVCFWNGGTLGTPEGQFTVGAEWADGRLAGWTLSKPE